MPHEIRFRPILLVLSFFAGMQLLYAQQPSMQNYMLTAAQLTNEGRFDEAIQKYELVLRKDPKYDRANYEMAQTYFMLGDFGQCIAFCDKALDSKSAYIGEAMLLKGNALAKQGKYNEAIAVYQRALVDNPNDYMLYYRMGLSEHKLNDLAAAEQSLIQSLKLNSTFADSHLALSRVMADRGERLKSVLALVNFLLIEPRGPRADKAFAELREEFSTGVQKNTDESLSISLNAKTMDASATEMVATLLADNKHSNKQSELEQFVGNAKTLFAMLGAIQKDKTDFWWNFYVRFYNDMNDDRQLETMCYFISQSEPDEWIKDWLGSNHAKIEVLFDWINNYTRRF